MRRSEYIRDMLYMGGGMTARMLASHRIGIWTPTCRSESAAIEAERKKMYRNLRTLEKTGIVSRYISSDGRMYWRLA